jgi:colicin import membrane protein
MSNQNFDAVVHQELTAITITESPATGYDILAGDYKAIHEAQLKKLEGEVADLPPITDKKTYEANQRKRTELVEIRTGIDKRRKALFEPVRRLKEEVDAYLGTSKDGGLQARISAMEEDIRRKQQAWDNEQERIRQEALAIIEKRNAARCKGLLDLGFTFDGAAYWIGYHGQASSARKSYVDICAMNDEAWEVFLRSAISIAKEVAEQKEAERQAELARLEQEARKREEAERKAAEERAELEKLREEKRQREAEALRQRNERNAYRIDRLRSLAGDFADELETMAWANLGELDDATWDWVQKSVSDAAVRMAEAESIRRADIEKAEEVVMRVERQYMEEAAIVDEEPEALVAELPDPDPAQEQRSVDKGLLEMALAAALSLLDEATAARSAVASTIAAQTLDRVIASAKTSVENLRGTINKDI